MLGYLIEAPTSIAPLRIGIRTMRRKISHVYPGAPFSMV